MFLLWLLLMKIDSFFVICQFFIYYSKGIHSFICWSLASSPSRFSACCLWITRRFFFVSSRTKSQIYYFCFVLIWLSLLIFHLLIIFGLTLLQNVLLLLSLLHEGCFPFHCFARLLIESYEAYQWSQSSSGIFLMRCLRFVHYIFPKYIFM